MPRVEIVIQVFVASPSDVMPEREVLESVILELNQIWSKKLRLRLELNRWETSVYPGFGTDPQNVINQQIKDEYDIFVGILWGKVGTQTPRAKSGTLEEFQRAYLKYQKDPESIDLMIYFKDAPISPSNIDPAQLSDLQLFRSSLGKQGGLYWTFESLSNFESLIRSHLSLVIQRWTDKKAQKYISGALSFMSRDETSVIENKETEVDLELGLFDYYDSLHEQAEKMEATLRVISEATIDVGQQIQRRAEELTHLETLMGEDKLKKTGKVIQLVSEDMNRYSSTVKMQLPNFSASRDSLFDFLSKALMLFRDFQVNEQSESQENGFDVFENQLLELNEGINTAKQGVESFKKITLTLPRVSSKFNKAKRNLVDALTETLKEFDSTLELSLNMLDTISQQKQTVMTSIERIT